MGGTDYGEMQPADIGATLALRNAVFVDDPPAPLTAADWAPRRLVVAPGLVIGVAVENGVGVRAGQLLPIFRSAYRRLGGIPPRDAGYWRRALASSIFTEMPTDFFLVLVPDEDAPVGYAIAGINTRRPGNPVEILELAAPAADLAIAGHLIARVGAFAAARELAVEMAASERIRSYPRCSPPASRPARATGW